CGGATPDCWPRAGTFGACDDPAVQAAGGGVPGRAAGLPPADTRAMPPACLPGCCPAWDGSPPTTPGIAGGGAPPGAGMGWPIGPAAGGRGPATGGAGG